ncbi:Hsp70 family protein [Mycobacterium sp. M1]|uniref:Hsp70 family protein n=1 Tax=Mycolicibacter acidiphilus TaxID=2835306 RepID=A0ABS5RE62_9MYCO|nr:Hsp70 family protein [Mycolicibacter acidiphilus]MBS9532570.1 Hsp70 family protein [Mycolicibacter acidiphilus]
MTEPLGLSIGTINLVAARIGQPPLLGPATLTLPDGTVMRGFVERVGYPAPLKAADGSTHRGEDLTAAALDALAGSAGYGAPVTVAVPAHWGPGPVAALRTALGSHPGLMVDGVPPTLIPDAAAAVAALEPRLPRTGVVALCDFGGSGTGITLVDAAAGFAPIGPTLRYGGFSGEQVDQAVLTYLLARLRDTSGVEPAGDTALRSLTRLREHCRSAKEQLTGQTATTVVVDLPGFTGEIPLTRTELATVIAVPLDGVVDAVSDTLARHGVATGHLTAVAIVGGGAAIPAVGTQLTERLGVPVIAASDPACAAATGAALLAGQPVTDTGRTAPTAAGSLAWSKDDSKAGEPLPYSESDYTFAGPHTRVSAPKPAYPDGPDSPAAPERAGRRSLLLITLAAVLAAVLSLTVLWGVTRSSDRPERPGADTAQTTSVTTTGPTTAVPPQTTPPSSTTPHRQHRPGR